MTQFVMDDGMKMLYKTIFDVDVEKCAPLEQHPSQFNIQYHGKKKSLDAFLSEDTTITPVTIDFVSTKGINDEACAKYPLPIRSLFERMYIEFQKTYGVIACQDKPIGFIVNISGYNGVGAALDVDAFLRNPQEVYVETLSKLQESARKKGAIPVPSTYQRTVYGLHSDFLSANPITSKSMREKVIDAIWKRRN